MLVMKQNAAIRIMQQKYYVGGAVMRIMKVIQVLGVQEELFIFMMMILIQLVLIVNVISQVLNVNLPVKMTIEMVLVLLV